MLGSVKAQATHPTTVGDVEIRSAAHIAIIIKISSDLCPPTTPPSVIIILTTPSSLFDYILDTKFCKLNINNSTCYIMGKDSSS